MKNLFIIILLFISMCLWAQNVPQIIDYQGRLADSAGNYLNGVYSVEFDLFDLETGGSELWIENQDVNVANGIFHVLLGSVNPFPAGLFDNSVLWLEFHVGAEILLPRTRIASVPYSIKAETAYTVEAPLNLTGNVASPNSVITGENTGTGYGVLGIHNSSNNIGYLGNSVSGVYGYCIEPTTKGVYGLHSSGNYGYIGSSDYGVYGQNYVSGGSGVYGFNTASWGYGVYGIHNGSGNYGYLGSSNSGVLGYSTGIGYGGYFEGEYIGVFGMVIPTGSSNYYGIYGNVSGGSGTNYAIYGYADYGSTNYAGYFSGNLAYTGTLINASDARFKENLQPFTNALSKIKLMNVHTYNYKQMEAEKKLALPEGEQIGLIAQELEEILPELVSDNIHAYDKNKGIEGAESDMDKIEYKGINYIGLIPVLIEAIKELNTQNEEQQKLIDEILRSAGK